MSHTHVLLGLGGFLIFAFVVVGLAILVFEIVMFIDVIRNDRIDPTVKALWIIGMLLLHPFVAIAYYFTDHKKTR